MSYESVGADIMDVDEGAPAGTTSANYKAINAPQSSFKPLAQVTTHTEAAAYAANGYQVSYKKKWYAAAELYFNAFAAARATNTRLPLESIKEMLRSANRAADKAAAAAAPPNVYIKPSNDTEVPDHIKSAGFMGGIPWWAMVGAAGAVYFLLNKKGGRKTSRKRGRKKARKTYGARRRRR